MKGLLTIFLSLIFVLSANATIPPRNGGALPAKVKEHTERMQALYPQGNLARIMQKWAESKRMMESGGQYLNKAADMLSYKFPVLIGKYSDAKMVQEDAPQELQKELFDGPWPTSTMREYYLENSYNQFEVTGTVYGWIQAAEPESLYTGPDGTYGMGGYAQRFVRELIDSVDADVNFADYDNDGDGVVESIIIVHSGLGQENFGSSSPQNHIWSHSSNLSEPYVTNDVNGNGLTVKIIHYIIQPAINFDGTLISIGVFCHEFGHAIGLPDLYDTDYSSEGIGDWGLMGGGSWNTPSSPSQFCAWSKEQMGWLTPRVIREDEDFVQLTSVEDHPDALKLWYQGDPLNQYFLLENRQKIGSDKNLHGTGMLIWHVDNSIKRNSNETHKLVDLEEADGLDQLDYNQSSGDAGDPFPGLTENTVFDYYSTPDSRAYNLADTKVAVRNIFVKDGTVYADLKVGMIRYEIAQMNFEEIGNSDGLYEPGEQVNFWVRIKNNTSYQANDVNVELTSLSQDITVGNPSVGFGNIASDTSADNSDNAFSLNIRPEAMAHTAKLNLHLTTSDGYEKDQAIDFVIGVPHLLVINRDQNNYYINNFRQLLEENNYAYQITNSIADSNQTLRYGQRENIAIVGGMNGDALSDSSLQDSLANWLTGNRGLLVVASGAASTLDTSAFAKDVLGIQYAGQSSSILLLGTSGDPLGIGGSMLRLKKGTREAVAPVGNSVASIKFIGTPNGGVTHYEDEYNNKVAYMSFDFGDIDYTSSVSASDLFNELMSWFNTPTNIVSSSPKALPAGFVLSQNYPNPFNPETSIRFFIPSGHLNTSLIIYNNLGEVVRQYDGSSITDGWNEIRWNGRNANGNQVGSGVYYYRLKADKMQQIRKMILMK